MLFRSRRASAVDRPGLGSRRNAGSLATWIRYLASCSVLRRSRHVYCASPCRWAATRPSHRRGTPTVSSEGRRFSSGQTLPGRKVHDGLVRGRVAGRNRWAGMRSPHRPLPARPSRGASVGLLHRVDREQVFRLVVREAAVDRKTASDTGFRRIVPVAVTRSTPPIALAGVELPLAEPVAGRAVPGALASGSRT